MKKNNERNMMEGNIKVRQRAIMKILGVRMRDNRIDPTSLDFVEIDLDEVNYISLMKSKTGSGGTHIFHTATDDYAPLLNLDQFAAAYKPYGFYRHDNSTVVNRRRIDRIVRDEYGLKIVFVDSSVRYVTRRNRTR
jgi:DNA-binding LytR/AlgR family response regulator